MRKVLMWACVLIGSFAIYNFDVILDRWKFRQLCKNEGGPRFYEPALKDMGWQVEGHDTYDYESPFYFDHVAFVRFEDKKGKRFDVRADGYVGAPQRRYSFSEVDEAKQVRYSFHRNTEIFGGGKFSKTQRLVTDVSTGKVVASFTRFGYSWTKPERVVLSAPTAIGCWDHQKDIDQFHHGIY